MRMNYGYRIEEGTAVIEKSEAEVLRTFFSSFLKVRKMSEAARIAGLEKTHSMLSIILKTEKYTGTDFYPQIIDNETFRTVQELRANKRVSKKRDAKTQTESKISISYRIGKVEKKFEGPYQQAAYAYSLIEEIVNE